MLVDPAAVSDYGKYRGATCITPNRTEAQLATGMTLGDAERDAAAIEPVARQLLDSLELECVVLTLDRQGALLTASGRGERAGADGGRGRCMT